MDKEARKILCDVLALLTNRFPFYSFFAFGWNLIEQKKLGTFATDIENLFYDPETVKKWNKQEILFALVHEVCHCIFLHPGTFGRYRLNNKNQALWEMAAEYVTNAETKEALQVSESSMPKGILYSPKYYGKTTEEVYEMLKNEVKTEPSIATLARAVPVNVAKRTPAATERRASLPGTRPIHLSRVWMRTGPMPENSMMSPIRMNRGTGTS